MSSISTNSAVPKGKDRIGSWVIYKITPVMRHRVQKCRRGSLPRQHPVVQLYSDDRKIIDPRCIPRKKIRFGA
jgi:hypothetical protein